MNSKTLSAALDRFNAGLPEADRLTLNWGRDGSKPSWWLHEEWGHNLQTGLSFARLHSAVETAIEAHRKWLAERSMPDPSLVEDA